MAATNRQMLRLTQVRGPDSIEDGYTPLDIEHRPPNADSYQAFQNNILSVLRTLQGSATWVGPPAPSGGADAALRSFVANCTANERKGDCVCYTAPRAADPLPASPSVARADITDIAQMPVIGIIVDDPQSGLCTVLTDGPCTVYEGLTPGARYFVGPGGQAAAYPFAAPIGAPHYLQRVGVAQSSTILVVRIQELSAKAVP